MILTINAGNTNITMGCYANNKLLFAAAVSTAANRTKDELAVSIKNMFNLYNYKAREVQGVIISCAAPFLTSLLTEAVVLLFAKEPLIVGPGIKTGLNILIDDPSEMGSDIVAACVAASAKYPRPLIVIRLGTAIVMSAINSKGQHIGGVIAPGMELSFEALSLTATQLPQVRIQKPEKVIGPNTIAAMQSGVFYGTVSMLEGMIRRFEAELNENCNVIMTGEPAKELCRFIDAKTIFDPALILDGLHLLYRKNTGQ